MVAPGYLRFPHICGDLVAFVAADDMWLAPVVGGRAWRFTTDAASRLALETLRDSPAVRPPDRSVRPSRRRPSLPPRPA